MRRQELSGSVQCSGRFVEDRVEGLEDVRHPGGDVEGDLDVGGGGLPGEADGVVEQDLAVADVARKAGCSTLVVLSKWDVTTLDLQQTRGMLNRRLRQRPPAVAVSALTGRGLRRLLDHVETLFAKHTTRIPTPALNKALGELKEARPGPAGERGRRLKLLYATQTATRPPRLRIFVNDPRLVTRDYGYWVENQLRERLGLDGVPVVVDFRARS